MLQVLGSGGAKAFCLNEPGSNPGMEMAFFKCWATGYLEN